jgi:hypothetical protein
MRKLYLAMGLSLVAMSVLAGAAIVVVMPFDPAAAPKREACGVGSHLVDHAASPCPRRG